MISDRRLFSSASLFLLLILLAMGSIVLSLVKGSTSLSIYQLLSQQHVILFDIRLPRTIAAFTCGGLLALSGALMQVLLQNPLADPYALGISGGAAFWTLLLMCLGIYSPLFLWLSAWGGSISTMGLIFIFAHRHRWHQHTLLLIGIAFAGGFSAAISFMLLIAPEKNIHSMLFWLTGDLSNVTYPDTSLLILGFGLLIGMSLAPGLNLFVRGEQAAQALGLSPIRYRISLFLLASFLTATAVTLGGCISFIGLLIPHVTRQLVGFRHQLLLPASVLLGGTLLTLADTASRTLFSPAQLPVGILTAFLGVPCFIWLAQKG